MKTWIPVFLALLFIACDTTVDVGNETAAHDQTVAATEVIDTAAFRLKAKEALFYAQKHKMSTNRCILISMKIHSGLRRWIEWDFKKGQIVSATMVTHGCGTKAWSADGSKIQPQFSNIPDSHLSSLGKYKIGERGSSQWGIGVKYLLHGLEQTNNNALKRFIVLHSWEKVSDTPTFPRGAPESWGCPAVSNKYMEYIDRVLQAESKPVLMWIYQ